MNGVKHERKAEYYARVCEALADNWRGAKHESELRAAAAFIREQEAERDRHRTKALEFARNNTRLIAQLESQQTASGAPTLEAVIAFIECYVRPEFRPVAFAGLRKLFEVTPASRSEE